jgi:hypothetical protein
VGIECTIKMNRSKISGTQVTSMKEFVEIQTIKILLYSKKVAVTWGCKASFVP